MSSLAAFVGANQKWERGKVTASGNRFFQRFECAAMSSLARSDRQAERGAISEL
jgi:hypothetical protein